MADPIAGPANPAAEQGPTEEQIQQMAKAFSMVIVSEIMELLNEDSDV
jgi:hypothetical protein